MNKQSVLSNQSRNRNESAWRRRLVLLAAQSLAATFALLAKQTTLAAPLPGTLVAWGYNLHWQTNVPAGLSNVVAIAVGAIHSLALTQNGTVLAWGNNDFGQATVPVGLSNIVAIAAGETHSLALKRDGTVVAWGN